MQFNSQFHQMLGEQMQWKCLWRERANGQTTGVSQHYKCLFVIVLSTLSELFLFEPIHKYVLKPELKNRQLRIHYIRCCHDLDANKRTFAPKRTHRGPGLRINWNFIISKNHYYFMTVLIQYSTGKMNTFYRLFLKQ